MNNEGEAIRGKTCTMIGPWVCTYAHTQGNLNFICVHVSVLAT